MRATGGVPSGKRAMHGGGGPDKMASNTMQRRSGKQQTKAAMMKRAKPGRRPDGGDGEWYGDGALTGRATTRGPGGGAKVNGWTKAAGVSKCRTMLVAEY